MTRDIIDIEQLPSGAIPLKDRVFAGDCFMVRGAFTKLGELETLRQASLRGIRRALGDDVANRVAELGFEGVHKVIAAADIPRVTEFAYQEVLKVTPAVLRRAVPAILGTNTPFYFEPYANVRFHVPYDNAAHLRKEFQDFGKRRGEGKITAHGPHRDSWLDCPTNALNIWVAVGAVESGNGMVVYPDAYHAPIPHEGCHITKDVAPGVPNRFSMQPGDAFVFHGDQLHASTLNYTDQTRHVISFRLTLARPQFSGPHLHEYSYSPLAVPPFVGGPLAWVPGVPAKLTKTYFTTRLRLVGEKLGVLPAASAAVPAASPDVKRAVSYTPGERLEPGDLRALDQKTCVARLHDGKLVAFSRRCTHEGADLALGYVVDGTVRCPWHGIPFDVQSGKSPCAALKALKIYDAEERDGKVEVLPRPAADGGADHAAE
jgi:nitrite reductase/ring-hydroxylating ferredoxin subunit